MKRMITLKAFAFSVIFMLFASHSLLAQNETPDGGDANGKAKTEKRAKNKKEKEAQAETPGEGESQGSDGTGTETTNRKVRITKVAEFDFVGLADKDGGADFKGYMNFQYGWGFNFDVAPKWEVGFELLPVSLGRVKFKQNDNKTQPTAIEHDKEKYTFWAMNVNGVGRRVFSYQPDGKTPKFYADAGVGLNLPYRFRHVTVDKVEDGPRTKTINSRIGQKVNFTGLVRVGYSFMALKLGWRFSKIFKDDSIYPNPPAMTLGLSFTWDAKMKLRDKQKGIKL